MLIGDFEFLTSTESEEIKAPTDSVDETLFAGLRTLHPDMTAAEKGF